MTREEAEAWVKGEEYPTSQNYTQVREDEITAHHRWAVSYEQVVQRLSDHTFWKIFYRMPATEYQDGEELDVRVMQVEPYEQVIIKYRKKR